MKVVVNNIKKIVVFGTVLLLVLGIFGGVASASPGYAYFTGTVSVLIIEAVDLRLSQDGGDTWTANLLDGSISLDFASVEAGEKVGNLISNKPLPTGTYNQMVILVSNITIKGAVEVDPGDWGGTWDGSNTDIRYYYTQADGTSDKYENTLVDAEAAAEEYSFVYGEDVEFGIDIDIFAGETTVYSWEVPAYLEYEVEYDDEGTKEFIEGWFFSSYQG